MADNFVLRFLGSTVRDCHCKYKHRTVFEAGNIKLSPSMYMQNIIKMCAAPVYWLFVAGASAAAIDFATAMDSHCRNRSARSRQCNKFTWVHYYWITVIISDIRLRSRRHEFNWRCVNDCARMCVVNLNGPFGGAY